VLALAPLGRGPRALAERAARQAEALAAAAELAGMPAPARFPRDAGGAPLAIAERGATWHWSVSNTRGAVAAAVARAPLGVDVESLARPRSAPAAHFADAAELALAPDWPRELALCLWTAKEALLKRSGAGIAELRGARLVEPPELGAGSLPGALVLEHRGERTRVALRERSGFVVALAAGSQGAPELVLLSRFAEVQP
jgi:hypothetical protein